MSPKRTFNDLISGDAPVTMEDILDLEEIQCRPEIVAAALRLLQDEKHSRDGYNILGPLAAEGDAEAQLIMGDFCESVLDRPQQAAIWFQRAADQGLAKAQRNYADMLMAGKGVKNDPAKAIIYYEKAATAGIPEAQFVMGEFCRNGTVTPRDDKRAIYWYEQAMQQGYRPSEERLRKFYPDSMNKL